ncbi:elongation factor P hydroxylase [Teredinibacter waterburyi]|uniref:elongation factor P hydroxylase n=1 Tax=Teredinibacter waterburyi TaxID=1500538 RepID=UPI00165FDE84|nr:elongation factor P hydroxylase [Teredinibacter waterburyi]
MKSKLVPEHSCIQLIEIFNNCFAEPCNTRLEGGGCEPIYYPAAHEYAEDPARVVFSHDYFASALHEIAHWSIAGDQRRQQLDYGYWYAPDGRSAEQQALFEQVEVKPQALEWVFNRACAHKFRLSADNLTSELGATEAFKLAVVSQAQAFCRNGLPQRAAVFADALAQAFGVDQYLVEDDFNLATLAI